MKKSLNFLSVLMGLLCFTNLFSMEQHQPLLTLVDGEHTFYYSSQSGSFWTDIPNVDKRIRLLHVGTPEETIDCVCRTNPATAAVYPAGLETDESRLELMAAYHRIIQQMTHQPVQAPQVQQGRLMASVLNFLKRWGSPIRLDVSPRETIKQEFARAGIAWDRPAVKTFCILLGEIVLFYFLLHASNDLGSFRHQVSDHLIPSVGVIINPVGMFSKVTSNAFAPATRLGGLVGTGRSLGCLVLMPLIQSYIVFFAIHALEDLGCLLGGMAQTLFVEKNADEAPKNPKNDAHNK